jgi:two-component system CheB/CheR fusion protein
MRQLIEDLLEFSRLGSAERTFIKTDLGKITGEVVKELQDTIDEKQAYIESGEMVELKIIPFQFHQLMHNLIGNALKFSRPDNPPHIKIDSRIAKGGTLGNKDLLPNMNYCQITVEDNGIGFRPEYGEQIFEVFKRLNGKEAYPGTGIGLATVKRIVENHNGTITVDSKLDQGARFDIHIPVP